MMANTPQNRYQAMVEFIEAMIAGGHYPTGTKIPSLRTLCVEFELSRGTAARGLEYLAERGLLELRHGSGAYVTARKEPAASGGGRKIAVFSEHCNVYDSYCAHIVLGIQNLAAATGTTLNMHLRYYQQTSYEIVEKAALEADALLLLGNYDLFLQDLPRRRPVVGVDMLRGFSVASLVGMDNRQAMELAADFFLRRGIRRVKLLSFPVPLYQYRANCFSTEFRERGGEAETIQPLDKYEGRLSLTHEFYRSLMPLFADRDCGYLFVSGTECERTMIHYREATGRELNDDVCVLSIDGKSRIVPGYTPVNTIGPNYTEIGEVAFAECMRRIESPGASPRRIETSCILTEIS